ncbi:acetyl-CoA carboxylase biotin carboxyl carrier protein [Blochmannia endosymbiont of Colobopsis nipponica]|uniref:acetyl-CoA carboxylase biotin carboxyl carrier protein n=1 Tax=Blochmannia endosymbiont of Colobopsis nipponica TaxID=2681987 RepID=UPI001780011C|nr:acetyl-CoA carboxylase biotin carboxyl carrier protein [Blochmannia endosymbiont of Colobopsis nipponica]QOI11144.1 acetyl-CoA carboxylase biotin carboxyl carrier protein [Blochmannia endosymbiont of Colobopsis nipponica]
MNIREVKKLIKIVEKSDITELEISEGKKMIRIKRAMVESSLNTNGQSCITFAKEQISKNFSENDTNIKNVNKINNDYFVRSPMVGIFYLASDPSAKPFISIGQKVNIGDVLCIVEAMKMMNHIVSDTAGIIKKILLDNGQPVEFDEPLIIIEQS